MPGNNREKLDCKIIVNCWFTGQRTLQIHKWVEVDRHPHKQSQALRKILFSERHHRIKDHRETDVGICYKLSLPVMNRHRV